MSRSSGWGAAILVLIGCYACGAGGVRPTFRPFPQALVDTVAGDPEAVVEQVAELVREEGIELRWVRLREGYVETKWFNSETLAAGGARSLNTRGIVRLRFWTDRVTEHESTLIGEAVRRRVVDPSLPIREAEMHVEPDHPGHAILSRIVASVASGEHDHAH